MSMTFWMGVATTYAVIVAVGLAAGSLLASRFPRRGSGGGGSDSPRPAPYGGPSFAAEVPPLGSDFDRQLLPAAFLVMASATSTR